MIRKLVRNRKHKKKAPSEPEEQAQNVSILSEGTLPLSEEEHSAKDVVVFKEEELIDVVQKDFDIGIEKDLDEEQKPTAGTGQKAAGKVSGDETSGEGEDVGVNEMQQQVDNVSQKVIDSEVDGGLADNVGAGNERSERKGVLKQEKDGIRKIEPGERTCRTNKEQADVEKDNKVDAEVAVKEPTVSGSTRKGWMERVLKLLLLLHLLTSLTVITYMAWDRISWQRSAHQIEHQLSQLKADGRLDRVVLVEGLGVDGIKVADIGITNLHEQDGNADARVKDCWDHAMDSASFAECASGISDSQKGKVKEALETVAQRTRKTVSRVQNQASAAFDGSSETVKRTSITAGRRIKENLAGTFKLVRGKKKDVATSHESIPSSSEEEAINDLSNENDSHGSIASPTIEEQMTEASKKGNDSNGSSEQGIEEQEATVALMNG